MGRVAGEEDPAHPEAVGHADVDAVDGEPDGVGQPYSGHPGVPVEKPLEGLHRRGHEAPFGVPLGAGLQLPVVAVAEGTEQDPAVLVEPLVPEGGVEAVGAHVADHHALLGLGLSLEADAEGLAHGAAAAVAADQIGGGHRPAVGEGRGHPVLVLRELGELRGQFDLDPVLGQLLAEDLLGAPLRDDQAAGVGRVGGGGAVPEGDVVGHRDTVPVLAQGDVLDAGGRGGLPHAEVVEELAAALIEPLAPRGAVERRGLVDDAHGNAGAGEGAGERESGRPGAHDEYGGVGHGGSPSVGR